MKYLFLFLFLSSSLPSQAEELPKNKNPLQVSNMCGIGFGQAAGGFIEYENSDMEKDCDQTNIRGFLAMLGRAPTGMIPGEDWSKQDPKPYDINKDQTIDCEDFRNWKLWLKDQFVKGHRRTDGQSLRVEGCS